MVDGRDGRSLQWGAATRSRAGEAVCGDLAVVTLAADGALVTAVDGLGHGREAARAAQIAGDVVRTFAGDALTSLVRRCHEALSQTRGAAISLAYISTSASTVTWLGIGSVEGRLVTGGPVPRSRRSLGLVRGIVGDQLLPVRPATLEIRRGDIVILATDGIDRGFADALDPWGSPQEIAERILVNHGKVTDDALVVVLRYLDGHR